MSPWERGQLLKSCTHTQTKCPRENIRCPHSCSNDQTVDLQGWRRKNFSSTFVISYQIGGDTTVLVGTSYISMGTCPHAQAKCPRENIRCRHSCFNAQTVDLEGWRRKSFSGRFVISYRFGGDTTVLAGTPLHFSGDMSPCTCTS